MLKSQKLITLTTEFDSYDGRIISHVASIEPALQVQLDLEKAQTTEVDIEILVLSSSFFVQLPSAQ